MLAAPECSPPARVVSDHGVPNGFDVHGAEIWLGVLRSS